MKINESLEKSCELAMGLLTVSGPVSLVAVQYAKSVKMLINNDSEKMRKALESLCDMDVGHEGQEELASNIKDILVRLEVKAACLEQEIERFN